MAFHHTAQGLASLGRRGDDTLLHINKDELAGLEALLGPVTTNPETGMPEAFQWWELAAGLVAGVATMGLGSLAAGAIEGGLAAAEAGAAAETVATAAPVAETVKDTAIAANTVKDAAIAANTAKDVATVANAAKDVAAAEPLLTSGEEALVQGIGQQTGQKAGEVVAQQAANQVASAAPQTFAEGASQGMADTASAWTNPANYNFANAAKYGPMAMTIGGAEVAAAEAPGQRKAAQAQAQGTADMWNQQIQSNMGVLGYKGDPGQFYVGPEGVLQGTTPKIFTGGFGMAEGGLAALGNVQGVPVQVKVPEQDADTVEHGLSSLGQQGFANGGYANTQPFNPQQFYPQSQIRSAQPYAAAGNTGVVNTLAHGPSFNRGGYAKGHFLDGPGDGMSDDIPANIDGAEPVKLADGEFIIPADVVSILGNGSSKAGSQVLQQGLAAIRKAGTGNSQQVKQDAGRLAFERVVKSAGKRKRANSKRSA